MWSPAPSDSDLESVHSRIEGHRIIPSLDAIEEALHGIGIGFGDTLFVHNDLLAISKFTSDQSQLVLSRFTDALQRAVGPTGTLILPTFSYSFLDDPWSGPVEAFDVTNTASRTGALSEFFRRQPGVVRTDHPTHSVAIWGSKLDYYQSIGDSTFDKDSIFGKLHAKDATLVGLGVTMKFFTFIHYVEKQFGVPYRFDSYLSGVVQNQGRTSQKRIRFYKQKRHICQQHERFRDYLLSTGKVRTTDLGNGKLFAVSAREFFNEGIDRLEGDIHFFSQKKSLKRITTEKLKRLTSLVR